MDFTWYWVSMGVGVLLVTTLLTIGDKWPWHLSFDGSTLVVGTPWFVVVIANEGFDVVSWRKWSGVLITRRIKGTEHLDRYTGVQVFEDWFRYEARCERKWQR